MGRYSGRSFRLILMCIVSILLFVMELVIANIGNSLSLASDAFAVLSHFLSMIIALFGVRVSSIKQHRKSTFGFLRADVVGAFGNSIFAVALMFSILVEAVKRYINPQKTEEPLLILSAGIIGLLFNILNYVILDCCYCTAHMPQEDTETAPGLDLVLVRTHYYSPMGAFHVHSLVNPESKSGFFPGRANWIQGQAKRGGLVITTLQSDPFGEREQNLKQKQTKNENSKGSPTGASLNTQQRTPFFKGFQRWASPSALGTALFLDNFSLEQSLLSTGKALFGISLHGGDSLNTQNEPEETMKKEKKSEALNIRGVLLHVMGDALGSVVVVITAIIFYVRPLQPEDPCNWQCYIDPSLTIIMVIIILSSAFPLIKETAAILLQMVPKGVNMEELMSKLSAVPGISSVHEVHIWELISGKIIATLHIKYQKDRDYQDASRKIREIFHSVGIHNVTIQFEQVDLKDPVEQKDLLLLCSSPCISKGCEKQLCCPPGALPLAHVNGCAEHNGCPPLDTYPSDGLRRRETTEVAIEVSLDSCLSEHGQAPSKSQEDPHYVNSTHF
eukprot:XP_022271024.1 zinc transporter 10 [Canis lupus familiaris]